MTTTSSTARLGRKLVEVSGKLLHNNPARRLHVGWRRRRRIYLSFFLSFFPSGSRREREAVRWFRNQAEFRRGPFASYSQEPDETVAKRYSLRRTGEHQVHLMKQGFPHDWQSEAAALRQKIWMSNSEVLELGVPHDLPCNLRTNVLHSSVLEDTQLQSVES
ncbi:Hypothetical predicted protein [Podarcis lilfordi]|uniref:Uncharacterized protein n=1 Tax=Podarcis lilfordi TaxID=74358 RepID=A0AA35K3Y2_9SAUR|nr:Hypothetical predicted protein [Podarcis lilfordi]